MDDSSLMTFWDHLEALRKVLFNVVLIIVIAAIVVFCFKEILFDIILAPSNSDFILYRAVVSIGDIFGLDLKSIQDFNVDLFSTTLTAQFMIHLKIAFYFGLIVAMPYVLYQLYCFVSPALKQIERKYTVGVVTWSYLLFMMGVLLNYFVIFPLAFRFLGTYQVSEEVPNIITLESYTGMLLTLTMMMGILFELPILSWFLAELGLINADFMKKYRRHAFVAILIVGAVITPTTDIFTLMIVSVPIYILYEASISIVGRIDRQRAKF
jgi:sec-independent protein translocase protein TatC